MSLVERGAIAASSVDLVAGAKEGLSIRLQREYVRAWVAGRRSVFVDSWVAGAPLCLLNAEKFAPRDLVCRII